jgi:hypothetical protein
MLHSGTRCENNSRQSQTNSFSKLCGFDATCFGSYTRSHHQAHKIHKHNYYANRIMLFYIIYIYS